MQEDAQSGKDLWRGFVQFVALAAELGQLAVVFPTVALRDSLPQQQFCQLVADLQVCAHICLVSLRAGIGMDVRIACAYVCVPV